MCIENCLTLKIANPAAFSNRINILRCFNNFITLKELTHSNCTHVASPQDWLLALQRFSDCSSRSATAYRAILYDRSALWWTDHLLLYSYKPEFLQLQKISACDTNKYAKDSVNETITFLRSMGNKFSISVIVCLIIYTSVLQIEVNKNLFEIILITTEYRM